MAELTVAFQADMTPKYECQHNGKLYYLVRDLLTDRDFVLGAEANSKFNDDLRNGKVHFYTFRDYGWRPTRYASDKIHTLWFNPRKCSKKKEEELKLLIPEYFI